MKLNKLTSLVAVAGLSLLGFTACDDDHDYNPAVPSEAPEVFFPAQFTQEVVLGENDTEISFQVYRQDVTANSTVSLEWSGDLSVLTSYPSSVTFPDGSNYATGVITFDIAKFVPKEVYAFSVTIPGITGSAYWNSSIDYELTFVPWTNYGMSIYTDYFVGPVFGEDPITYEVQIMENPEMPGLYRLVNPYGAGFPFNEPGDYDPYNDYYMYINATNPEQVYLCDESGKPAIVLQGINWGYGLMGPTTFATYYLMNGQASQAAPYYGWVEEENGRVEIWLADESPLNAMGTSIYYGYQDPMTTPWIVFTKN